MHELIHWMIKFTGRNICVGYAFLKITNTPSLTKAKKLLIFVVSICLALFQHLLQEYTPVAFRVFFIYSIYSFILSKLSKISIGHSLIVTMFSLAMAYIMNFLSTIIITVIFYILLGITYTNPIILILTCILDLAMIHGVFKINRFKHGFPFIKNKVKNDYLDIFILAVTTVIISMNFITNFISNFSMRYFIIYFLLFIVVIIIITQKTFVLYHKQKLLSKSVKDYETELQETNQKLQTALAEKQKLVKSNHEFYHRQEALNKKLDDLINNHALDMKTEFGEDYGDILDRINTLSSEYASKMHTISKLSKTKIVEIDDMLSYMQSECSKNNIEFILKIECDVNYILNNFISKSQLETLLGDLIRNAIIAINHSTGDYRSIMVVFGIKDDSYELCICDSGIPFEITTLLNMGLQPASTHESEGGTGIGLLTTFETLESCNASFIINELTNNNYTKSLEIKFDGKKEYTIVSNRSETIKEMNVSKRNIIIKE